MALLAATSITVGWTGVLSTARGGNAVNIANTALALGTASAVAGQLTLHNATNAFTQTLRGTNPAASIIYDLPTTAPTLGQVLSATAPAAGVVTLSWATAASGVAIGDTITGATAGSVFFAGAAGVLAQDNANFFWDDAANNLIIKSTLTLGDASVANGQIVLRNSSNAFTTTIQTGVTGASYTLTLPTTDGAANEFLQTNGSGVLTWAAGGGGGALSAITAAVATNTIDNTLYAQVWNWSTLTTQTAFTYNANAITTGTILSLATSGLGALNSTNGLLYVGNTSAVTNGILARFQANSTSGSGVTILANGKVGIMTVTPSNSGAGITTFGAALAASVKFQNTATGVTSGDGVEIGIDASGNGLLYQGENLPIDLYTNAILRTTFLANGNIGTTGNLSVGTNATTSLTLDVKKAGANAQVYNTTNSGDTDFYLAGNNSGGTLKYMVQRYVANNLTDGALYFLNNTVTTSSASVVFASSGKVGIGVVTPTAVLHIKAGTATANTGQIKLDSGTKLTAAEPGVVEYNGNFYLSNATTRFSGGGVLPFDNYTDVTVGGAETDIYSATLLASTFNVNGDKVIAMYGGNFVTVGTELTQLKVYFAGTAIWDSTGVAPATGTTSWKVLVSIIRKTSTSVVYTVSLNTTGATGYVYCTSSELTALTLSNTNILKITGTSSGVGSGVGDIVGKMGFIEIKPAS